MEISWADVPSPFLELIVERLPFVDYLRFPAVCPSWRDEQHVHHLQHVASPRYQKQMPWLMYSNKEADQSMNRMVFYNPSEKRYYRIFFPDEDWDWNSKISYNGWFYSGLTIVNLFTGSQIPIHYPRESNMCPIISQADLIFSPTDPDCILLGSIIENFGNKNVLSNMFEISYQFRDKTWTSLNFNLDMCQAIVCGRKYYVLHPKGLAELEVLPIPFVRYIEMDVDEDQIFFNDTFLIECCGDILMAQMVRPFSDIYKFIVYKADLSRRMWVRLESLDDNMLFLSVGIRTSSFSLSAVDTGGPPNRIYYVEGWNKKNDNRV